MEAETAGPAAVSPGGQICKRMVKELGDKLDILQEHFGYQEFRGGQEELIDAVLAGRDVVGIMPTGAGKSLCFQVPALLLEGVTLVVSPLISLMKDQVSALIQSGAPAAFINSTLSPAQVSRALDYARQGRYKIIYVAPERLLTGEFLAFATGAAIPFVAVDEAHCVSQWGQDFRPSYLKVGEFIQALPAKPVVGGFTATATGQVRKDIVELLGLRDPLEVATGFDRANLYFEVQAPKAKFPALQAFLREREDKCGIVYCSTRKTVEQVHAKLLEQGYSATRYHAGLEAEERRINQELFQTDGARIMVATNAFGMGIDKSNVAYVVHYNMPKNLEAYYQEAGRAGRDGSPAECLLLYSGQDVVTNQFFLDNTGENQEMDPQALALFQRREKDRLRQMTFYCHTKDCLRAYVLDYFGEKSGGYCGNCFNCQHHFETVDITVEAQKILSCVKRMGERFGVKLTVDVLRGVVGEKVERLGFTKLSTFGLLEDSSEKRLREIISHLVLTDHLTSTGDAYPVLRLGPRAGELLFKGKALTLNVLKEEDPPKAKGTTAAGASANPRLYAKLQALRGSLAKAQSVPAYVIFSDAALREMCARLPQTPEELLRVNGVGKVKLEKYGERFLALIREEAGDGAGEDSPSSAPPKEKSPPPQEILARLMRDNLVVKGLGHLETPTGDSED